MSNSTNSALEGNRTQTQTYPRAIIHKRILDEARDSPDAPINAISAAVPGATADLVERVLEAYGDPGEATQENIMIENTADSESKTTGNKPSEQTKNDETQNGEVPNVEELTDRQRQTLRAVYEKPQATQGEIAETLDVTTGTVSKRINKIYGFDWEDREKLVNQLFENESMEANGNRSDNEPTLYSEATPGLSEKVDTLAAQVESLHQELTDRVVESRSSGMDPELAAKVIHASVQSENITVDEELEIVKAVLSNGLSRGNNAD